MVQPEQRQRLGRLQDWQAMRQEVQNQKQTRISRLSANNGAMQKQVSQSSSQAQNIQETCELEREEKWQKKQLMPQKDSIG